MYKSWRLAGFDFFLVVKSASPAICVADWSTGQKAMHKSAHLFPHPTHTNQETSGQQKGIKVEIASGVL